MPKKILFTDMDGTLLTSDKLVSPALCGLLTRMVSGGGRLVLSSGRSLDSILRSAQRAGLLFPDTLIIAANGNLIYDYDARQTLLKKGVPMEIGRGIIRLADRHGLHIQSYDDSHVVCRSRCPQLDYYLAHAGATAVLAEDIIGAIGYDPVKLLAVELTAPEKLEALRQDVLAAYGDVVTAIYSCPQYLEIFDKTAGKGNAIRFVCRHLAIPIRDSVAAGDAQNDISMLDAAGIAVAMANADPAVKEHADYVTQKDNDHDGLAEAILNYLL